MPCGIRGAHNVRLPDWFNIHVVVEYVPHDLTGCSVNIAYSHIFADCYQPLLVPLSRNRLMRQVVPVHVSIFQIEVFLPVLDVEVDASRNSLQDIDVARQAFSRASPCDGFGGRRLFDGISK